MNTINESYAGILKLLVAYELQHTLSQDEFLAIEHYQKLEYWVWASDPFHELESVIIEAPKPALAVMVDDSNPQAIVLYYLMQGEA